MSVYLCIICGLVRKQRRKKKFFLVFSLSACLFVCLSMFACPVYLFGCTASCVYFFLSYFFFFFFFFFVLLCIWLVGWFGLLLCFFLFSFYVFSFPTTFSFSENPAICSTVSLSSLCLCDSGSVVLWLVRTQACILFQL